MWTRGLDKGDTEWSEDGPWGDAGGHVLFSNGKVEWYEQTQSDEQPEVYICFQEIPRRQVKASNSKTPYTSDIGEAIPDDWEILKADG